MKKRSLSLLLCLVLVVTAVVGATAAYSTAQDSAVNTFAMGEGVAIKLEEEFVQGSVLKSGIKVNKTTKIVNTGTNDAWVWQVILVPAALDNNGIAGNLDKTVPQALQWNLNPQYLWNVHEWWNKENPDKPNPGEQVSWDNVPQVNGLKNEKNGYIGQETVDGVVYNKYVVLYLGKLAPGDKTNECLNNVRLAKEVDCQDGNYTYKEAIIDMPEQIKVIVRAYAIQAEPFETAVDAYNAYNS